jgi:D-amino-acid dehydrogenase
LGNAGMIVPSHIVPLAAPGMVGLALRMMLNPEGPFRIRPRISLDLVRWLWCFWRSANAMHVARAAPLLCELHLASRRCFEELAAETKNDFGLETRGLLMLSKTEVGQREEMESAHLASQLGLDAEILSAAEAAQLNPGVELDIAGAVYYPQDCHLTPQRFMATLTRLLERRGVTWAWSTEVSGWRVRHRTIEAVQTNRGEIRADEYIVAAGSWSPTVARGLRVRLPMQAGKGYSITHPAPPHHLAMGCILTEARVAVTPMGSALRIGGTMEIAGLDQSINNARVSGIVNAVPRYFPQFSSQDFRGLPVWSGLRPCSPDGLPYVGRFANYDNLWAATGHAMMGLSLGPITGKLMAEMLSNEKPAIDVALLSPDRFSSYS